MSYCTLRLCIILLERAVPDIKELNVRVYGIIGGIPVEFTMPQPNACVGSGLTCPLDKGQPVQYLTYVPVLPMYPNVCIL